MTPEGTCSHMLLHSAVIPPSAALSLSLEPCFPEPRCTPATHRQCWVSQVGTHPGCLLLLNTLIGGSFLRLGQTGGCALCDHSHSLHLQRDSTVSFLSIRGPAHTQPWSSTCRHLRAWTQGVGDRVCVCVGGSGMTHRSSAKQHGLRLYRLSRYLGEELPSPSRDEQTIQACWLLSRRFLKGNRSEP